MLYGVVGITMPVVSNTSAIPVRVNVCREDHRVDGQRILLGELRFAGNLALAARHVQRELLGAV